MMARFGGQPSGSAREILFITGGVGIADQWNGNAQDPEHWRDSHFMVEGPTVAQSQSAFMDNWLKTRQCVLHGVEYFPKLVAAGATRAQVFMSSPGERWIPEKDMIDLSPVH